MLVTDSKMLPLTEQYGVELIEPESAQEETCGCGNLIDNSGVTVGKGQGKDGFGKTGSQSREKQNWTLPPAQI